uniref:Uncharacterized protein n=1 Tax=Anguilla anguilla TaxID=7936 RepID=A0A0E9R6U7_ANGAN
MAICIMGRKLGMKRAHRQNARPVLFFLCLNLLSFYSNK